MTIFDLIFLALVGVSLAAWLTAAAAAVSRHGRRACRVLMVWAAGFSAYMSVVAAASAVLPRRTFAIGEPECNDDWCLAVEKVERAGPTWRVGFRISSRALRVTQREHGVSVYLTDGQGRKWAPVDSPDVPFDVALGPGESVATARAFALPADARPVGLVIRHDTGFPIGWFIIGYDTWFRKPALVRIA
jgi:hypothetical protein